jgi:long-chain-fatty-acid--CoA ligase ACSBG
MFNLADKIIINTVKKAIGLD